MIYLKGVTIWKSLTKNTVSWKVGAAKNKLAGIKSKYAPNVTVRYSFEGNSMLKQPSIITLEKVLLEVRIFQLPQLK